MGGDPGRTPIVNWLLWGYGVPALAFFLASRVMQRHGRDRVVRFVESLSNLNKALLSLQFLGSGANGSNGSNRGERKSVGASE